MKSSLTTVLALLVLSVPTICLAQETATPSPEHAILKKDAGRWEAKVKMFTGPGDPQESSGLEVNRMIGEFWLVSDYKGEMMGQEFHGSGTFGYDPEKKQYFGSWVDSFSPAVMHMTGSYDAATKTMTFLGEGKAPDGTAMKSKLVTVTKDDGTRHMTMHAPAGGTGEMMKVMEIVYTKVKRQGKKNQ